MDGGGGERAAVAVLVVGSVLAVDPWGWYPFGPFRWLVTGTALLIALTLLLRRNSIRIHRGSALGWAAFLAWAALSGVGALDPLYAWIGTPDRRFGFLTVVLLGAAFLLGQNLATHRAIQTLLRSTVVALSGLGLYTVLEVIGLAPVDLTSGSGRPGGPFGTPAYLGAACALLIPAVIGVAVDRDHSPRWRYAAAAAAVLGSFAALAAQTRAGWVGLVVAAVVAAPALRGWLRRRWTVVAAAGALLVIVAVLSPIGGRISGAFDFAEGTARGRIDEWQVGAAVAVRHPVWGTGLEGYRIAFAEGVDADYERRYTRVTMPDRVHNGPLDVAVTTGLPGVALYLAAAGFLLWRARSAARAGAPLIAGIGAGVAGYIGQQFFLFPISEVDPVFWLFAGVLVAATESAGMREFGRIRLAWILPAVLAAAVLATGTADVVADHRGAAAARDLAAGDGAAALEAADTAARLRPDSIRYHLLAAVAAASEGSAAGYGTAVERVADALAVSPGDPILRAEHASYLLRQAQAEHSSSLLEGATAEWEDLVDYDPVHARYRLELGNAYALAGSRDGAETQWLIAADLAPRSTAPWVNLAQLYIDAGRDDAAAAAIDAIAAIDPAEPRIRELRALMETN